MGGGATECQTSVDERAVRREGGRYRNRPAEVGFPPWMWKPLASMGFTAGQSATKRRQIVLINKYCGLQATVEYETKAAVEEAPHAKSTQIAV